jgi:CelD/BcsL family acetyltransferase involved in cellulose biosynthesis
VDGDEQGAPRLADGHCDGLVSIDVKLALVDPYSSDAERIWRDLEGASRPAYFLTWAWVSNWLACLPRSHAPWLAVITATGRPLAAFFLAKRKIIRSKVVPSRALYFNTTGVERIDAIWIEYNGLLGRDMPLTELLPLLPDGWDELYLPALREHAFGDVLTTADTRVVIERRVPAPFVDLEQARAKGYLSLLSGQTRSQVRRAQREAGEVSFEIARDAKAALDIYSEMVELHTAHWHAKGKPGAFADPWFDRFHRRLITNRFAHGEIELVRMRHRAGPLGCLYNLVHDGRVSQYQSGFATFENEKLKPGFIAHTAAIEHAAASGRRVYDFLAGDQRYKKQLATDSTSMVWARVQQRRLRFLVEDRVRRWRAQRP